VLHKTGFNKYIAAYHPIFEEFYANRYRNRKKATVSAEVLVIFMGVKLYSPRQRNAEDCCLLEYDSMYLVQTF
jgi:hypothetical protein